MSYVSLARKYRPRRFLDMVGQESTTLALTNAIRLRREPHSVIFTGVRGVGKTTSARIYAKALNCENGPTPDPCDVCASCMAIVAGNHEDVLEIDGASNTGVDDVRALQETLSYVPQRSTYKIYIIDEVHMLSISAFNALLKTLEEPPQHVVFIFATTELHKVPETIQSRCQTFHLQKISRPVIIERVRSILTSEGIPFDEGALAIVAREGRGSMRDALTMLDQAIAVGGGQVSLEALRNMVGSSSQALPVLELLDGLLRKDAAQILEVIARWDQEGLGMSTLAEETAKACRNAFILRDLKGQAIDLQLLELEDREQQMLLELGEKAAPMDLNRLFRQLAKCLDDLRHADLDRFVLENYCLEWCFDPGLPDLQTLMNLISSGQPLPPVTARAAPQTTPSAEGSAINLRERWKTSSPAAPASRPAAGPQTPSSAPGPASPMAAASPHTVASKPGSIPGEKPSAPLSTAAPQPVTSSPGPLPHGKPSAPQAHFEQARTQAESGGKGSTSAGTQPMSMAQHSEKSIAPSGSVAVGQATAHAPVSHAAPGAQPMPQISATQPKTTPQPTEKSLTPQPGSELASPVPAQPQATPQPSGMSLLAQRLARTQAAQTAAVAQTSAANQGVGQAPLQSQPSGQAQSAPKPAAAQQQETSRSEKNSSALNQLLSRTQPTAVPPSQHPEPPAEPIKRPDQLAKNRTLLSRTGGAAQPMPPEPLPPFDPAQADDEPPPWVLQDEAVRHGAVAAPQDEPVIPELTKSEGFLAQMARKAATAAPVETPKVETPAAPPAPPVAHEPIWPENWRAFVDEWKKQKPLQGRILEEAYVLEYSQQRIRLAVEPTSMAGGKLLQQDVRRRLMEQFIQLFGFQGVLEAVPKADAHPGQAGSSTPAPDLGETLLDVKNREREVAREQLRHRLEEHPMTREVISRFGGTIEQIELQ